MSEEKENIVGEVSLYISDGGAAIAVEDSTYGPKLIVRASHFGHRTNEMALYLHPDALSDLAELFKKAAEHKYRFPPYCIAIGQHHEPCCEPDGCKGHSTKDSNE